MPKQVLFVCIKNSSRSQMAEALLRQERLHGVKAYSAGIHPANQVNPTAIAVMHEIGCDLRGYETNHVSDFQDITFDVVVKMDSPDLGDYVNARWMENWEIPDPAKGGKREFRVVRDLLAERVRRLGESIGDGAGRARAAAAAATETRTPRPRRARSARPRRRSP